MWLTGATEAAIAYCLVNTPFGIIEQEKKSLLYKMDVISEESPEYVLEASKLELNMMFDDIDTSEKVLIFPVKRSESRHSPYSREGKESKNLSKHDRNNPPVL